MVSCFCPATICTSICWAIAFRSMSPIQKSILCVSEFEMTVQLWNVRSVSMRMESSNQIELWTNGEKSNSSSIGSLFVTQSMFRCSSGLPFYLRIKQEQAIRHEKFHHKLTFLWAYRTHKRLFQHMQISCDFFLCKHAHRIILLYTSQNSINSLPICTLSAIVIMCVTRLYCRFTKFDLSIWFESDFANEQASISFIYRLNETISILFYFTFLQYIFSYFWFCGHFIIGRMKIEKKVHLQFFVSFACWLLENESMLLFENIFVDTFYWFGTKQSDQKRIVTEKKMLNFLLLLLSTAYGYTWTKIFHKKKDCWNHAKSLQKSSLETRIFLFVKIS